MSAKLNPAKLLAAIAKLPPNPAYDRLKGMLVRSQEVGIQLDLNWLSGALGHLLFEDWARAKRKATVEDLDLQAGLEHAVGGAVIVALTIDERFADDIEANSRWN